MGVRIEFQLRQFAFRRRRTMNYCGRAKGFPLGAAAIIVAAPQTARA